MLNQESTNTFSPTLTTAIVTNNNDPESLGRVKVQYTWSQEHEESDWIRISMLMAGEEFGAYFVPEVEQEVLVAFVNGDLQSAIVIGSLWNASHKPPQESDEGKNNIRKIRSRSGHEIVFDDSSEEGTEKLELHSVSGHKIVLDDSSGSEKISIEDGAGGLIELDSSSKAINIKSSMEITLEATTITLNASGELVLKGGLVKIN